MCSYSIITLACDRALGKKDYVKFLFLNELSSIKPIYEAPQKNMNTVICRSIYVFS